MNSQLCSMWDRSGFRWRTFIGLTSLFWVLAPIPQFAVQREDEHLSAIHLEAASGTKASYRVREQLAGLDFPN
jgi:hypothetical protein